MKTHGEAGDERTMGSHPGVSVSFDAGRRRFLGLGIAALMGFFLTDPLAAAAEERLSDSGISAAGGGSVNPRISLWQEASPAPVPCIPRSLSFFNTHTDESLETVYWCEGDYRPNALRAIDRLLRDHRTEEVKRIDPDLLDLLNNLRLTIGSDAPFHVISGYRSPATNADLRLHGPGVAAGSLHMAGQAIDIRLPGTDLRKLHETALGMKAGGVGYYPASDFVHVDTGRVRKW